MRGPAPAATGRSGPPTRPSEPSSPSTASSASASRSAAAAIADCPRFRAPPPARAGGAPRPARSTSSASTSSPWSAGSAMPSTAASRRSTPSWPAAACRSAPAASATCWTATTSCWRSRLSDAARLRRITAAAGRVILAIDGLQPDVGHEVLWVLRDVLSGEVLLARSLLSSTQDDLAKLIGEVKAALPVPIAGVVSDGQDSIRKAVKQALDGVPHQLCHFHYLREAAKPVYEADRHAKVQLKKKVRGIRPIERQVEGRDGCRGAGHPGLLRGGPLGVDR